MYWQSAVCSCPIHNNNKQWSLTTHSFCRRVRKTAKRDYWFCHVCLSVPPAWNNSAPTRRIFMKLHRNIFRKSIKKNKISLNSDKNNTYSVWRPIYICDHISFSVSREDSRENSSAAHSIRAQIPASRRHLVLQGGRTCVWMETSIASVSWGKGHSVHPHKFRPFMGRKMYATNQAGVPP